MENKYEQLKNKKMELQEKIKKLIEMIHEFRLNREKEINDFEELENESKTLKLDIENLQIMINDKDHLIKIERDHELEQKNIFDVTKQKSEKNEYHLRKIENKIHDKTAEKNSFIYK